MLGLRWERAEVTFRYPTSDVPQAAPTENLTVGAVVTYRRRQATLLAVWDAPTPGGATVRLARIQFPKGGEQTVFAHQLS